MKKRIIGIALLTVSSILLFAWGDRVNQPDEDPTEAYYESIKDKDGFCIKDGILYAYLGKDKEITIPETVTEIYNSALSGDFGHGANLKKVIVPGTVKKINGGAFAFTSAKKIIVEEGVKEIGEWAFGDSYIEEIWFPASLEKIGNRIMETEEGLDGTKIHVPKNSEISQYFEQNMPYGNAELIYD
ncbi:leucine-rich repeat domain-containing protein [Clostridium aminobutyricum]|uniref:Leucine-rich repeat domain-containing protein n=1 Tax=Clostridium aminobutyricum TaxID=33953 RepID=A0A939IGQ7_CLOAM|nr:leucine-rich repeat domain-containing protein [Clostridium aminobutyricum]MBN7772317.1 leucine-rich repeat domain-containing protein [Clostridium aminobutyricum]